MHLIEGKFHGENKKFAIIVSRFNDLIGNKLLAGATDCLSRHGVRESDMTMAWVPGAFEIPSVAKKLAKTGKFDGIICLGAVIRGSTPHFDYVSNEVAKGVASVSLSENMPVIFGVLTTNSVDEAIERAGTKGGNKGWDAALAALEMVNLCGEIDQI